MRAGILLLALFVVGVAGQYQPGAPLQRHGGVQALKRKDEAADVHATAAADAVAAADAAAAAAQGQQPLLADDSTSPDAIAAAAADVAAVDKQYVALTKVKAAIDVNKVLTDWTGAYYCSWKGIECLPGPSPQKVATINIWEGTGIKGLKGKLPTAAVLKDLPALVKLGIGDQPNITGTIPADYSTLTNLQELRLANNSLTGTLPAGLAKLKKLKLLYAYNNQLVKVLPNEWRDMAQMQDLQLADNQLTGTLPTSWAKLKMLKKLYLFGNKLKGPLPDWSALTNLEELAMYDMNITGTLPASYKSLKKLKLLYLYNNYLSGSIPAVWAGMSAMEDFELADNILSGEFPKVLGPKWPKLSLLYLYYNTDLTGCLPKEWKTQLANFDVNEWVYDGTGIKAYCT